MERSLRGIALFEGMSDAELRRLEAMCQWRRYRDGQRILDSGVESREVFFVVRGAANIVNYSLAGREVAFAIIREGNYFGELAAIDGKPRSANVIAAGEALLAALSAERFLDLVREHPDIAVRLLRRLTSMVRTSDLRIMELTTLAASQRVYAELLRMAEPDAAVANQWVIRPLPPLREIASRVGTTRETAARAMAQIYRTDIVRRRGRNLYLLDRAALEDRIKALESPKV